MKGVDKMRKALVVVDMQRDFIDGKLGNKECQAVVSKVVDVIRSGEYESIIITRDTHFDGYMNTQEGRKLPVEHCIYNTDGWMLDKDVDDAIKAQAVRTYTVDKSTFGSLKLADILKNDFSEYDEIDFCGVCTGICVISNVAIAKAALPEVKVCVIENACACVTPDTHKTAIEAMRTFQVDIV